MKLDFYGVDAAPPSVATIKAFGSTGEAVRLQGGQGTTYRVGDIILKPSEGADGGAWMADVLASLAELDEVRFARPARSVDGSWIVDGYVAWNFLPGEHTPGQYAAKLTASRAFHTLLEDVSKPKFLEEASSPWAAANLAVWGDLQFNYGPEFAELIDQILPHLKSYEVPAQLIHGDMSGNFLLKDGLSPALIDFSPAWAPAGFAEGIMLADAVTWEGAAPEDLTVFDQVPDIEQLAWRGVLRRIAEQGEHISWFGKDQDQAIEEARAFEKAITYLNIHFG